MAENLTDPIAENPLADAKTPGLGLPLLVTGQGQKDITHNEALMMVDAMLLGVVDAELGAPPAAATPGQMVAIGTSPSGLFAGRAGGLAVYTSGGWRFLTPHNGYVVHDRARNFLLRHHNGQWVQPPALVAPTGGAVVDEPARTAIAAVIGALRDAGLAR